MCALTKVAPRFKNLHVLHAEPWLLQLTKGDRETRVLAMDGMQSLLRLEPSALFLRLRVLPTVADRFCFAANVSRFPRHYKWRTVRIPRSLYVATE